MDHMKKVTSRYEKYIIQNKNFTGRDYHQIRSCKEKKKKKKNGEFEGKAAKASKKEEYI